MNILRHVKLTPKLIVSFLIAGLVPVLLIGWTSASRAAHSLDRQVAHELTAVAALKKREIEQFFTARFRDAEILSRSADIRRLYRALHRYQLDSGVRADGPLAVSTPEYRAIWKEESGDLLNSIRKYGYPDVLIISGPHGQVMYSAASRTDLGTNLGHGPLAHSSLASLWHKVVTRQSRVFEDFAPYPAADGRPVAFIGTPVRDDRGKLVAVLALRISPAAINDIMRQRDGMGSTGETFLVGPDKRMRSDAVLDPDHRSVKASFAGTARDNGVDTDASRAALNGIKGVRITKNYRGRTVLCAFTPVRVGDVTWAVLAETGEAEVRGPVRSLHRSILIDMGILSLSLVAVALVLARHIAGPLISGVGFANRVAAGDFTATLDETRQDEAGQLARAMNRIVEATGTMLREIRGGIETLASSSTELSTVSEQVTAAAAQTTGRAETVAAAAGEMSAKMGSVAATVEQAATNVSIVAATAGELSSAISEISGNTAKASAITSSAVADVRAASEKIGELGHAANEIGKVTETITEISDQTNLLALNATIEAARAGDAGKGFAVVANEIKELAKQTVEATGEIRTRIESIQHSSQGTVTQIGRISTVIDEINTIVATIAAAVEEQTATTREIADNMSQATQGLQEVSEHVAQGSTVSNEIASDIAAVNRAAAEMNGSSGQVMASVRELSELAEQLRTMAGRFKV